MPVGVPSSVTIVRSYQSDMLSSDFPPISEVSPKPMKLTNGNDALGAFSAGLADGQANATHNYRDFDVSVQGVEPGDQIELWMRNADGSGGQVTGGGQDLYAKDFKLLSQTPSIVQNPALHYLLFVLLCPQYFRYWVLLVLLSPLEYHLLLLPVLPLFVPQC